MRLLRTSRIKNSRIFIQEKVKPSCSLKYRLYSRTIWSTSRTRASNARDWMLSCRCRGVQVYWTTAQLKTNLWQNNLFACGDARTRTQDLCTTSSCFTISPCVLWCTILTWIFWYWTKATSVSCVSFRFAAGLEGLRNVLQISYR